MDATLRRQVLQRDNNTCQICYTTEKKLDVHHIIKVRMGGRDVMDNLVAVCRNCHRMVDTVRKINIGTQLNVRLPDQLLKELKVEAYGKGMSLRSYVSKILKDGIRYA